MERTFIDVVGAGILVLASACGSSAPPPATPATTNTIANETPSETAAAATPTGLALLCVGQDLRLEINDATLTLAMVDQKRAQKRWNQIKATYKLDVKGTPKTGTVQGVRDADFVFMDLTENSVSSTRGVRVMIGSPRGDHAHIEWPTGAGVDARASGDVTCSGSLMTATPSDT